MREIRLSGSEGGGTELNRFSLPLSPLMVGLPLIVMPFSWLGPAFSRLARDGATILTWARGIVVLDVLVVVVEIVVGHFPLVRELIGIAIGVGHGLHRR
jgi:hypothetical protein